jgi:hypothetical protein
LKPRKNQSQNQKPKRVREPFPLSQGLKHPYRRLDGYFWHSLRAISILKKFGKIFNFPKLGAGSFQKTCLLLKKNEKSFRRSRSKFGKIFNFPELFKKLSAF